MDTAFIDRVKTTLNNDVARRLLIKYFVDKGYCHFDMSVYPAIIQDMPITIPEMADKVEVVPHARKIDPVTDTAELGWNLFVLGNQRMYLGETYHVGLKQLALQLQQNSVLSEDHSASRLTTPRNIVNFVTRVLGAFRSGYINLTPRILPLNTNRPFVGGPSAASHFFRNLGTR